MTAQTPRFFRFAGTSNSQPLDKMFTCLISMDIEQLKEIDIKEYLLQSLQNMTPDQVKVTIDQLAGAAAEINMKRLISATSP